MAASAQNLRLLEWSSWQDGGRRIDVPREVNSRGGRMYNILYIIGLIVVILIILSLLGII